MNSESGKHLVSGDAHVDVVPHRASVEITIGIGVSPSNSRAVHMNPEQCRALAKELVTQAERLERDGPK